MHLKLKTNTQNKLTDITVYKTTISHRGTGFKAISYILTALNNDETPI